MKKCQILLLLLHFLIKLLSLCKVKHKHKQISFINAFKGVFYLFFNLY